MADTKVSALAAVTTLADSDPLYVVASSDAKKITTANLATAIGGRLTDVARNAFAAREEQSATTDGGTFTSGDWRTRTLNTLEEFASAYTSLSTNVLTVPAGLWLVWWSAPAWDVNSHQTRVVVNKAGSPEYHYGESSYAAAANNVGSTSSGLAIIDQASSFTIELQHRCETTVATFGMGVSAGWATEVYAQILGIRLGAT